MFKRKRKYHCWHCGSHNLDIKENVSMGNSKNNNGENIMVNVVRFILSCNQCGEATSIKMADGVSPIIKKHGPDAKLRLGYKIKENFRRILKWSQE